MTVDDATTKHSARILVIDDEELNCRLLQRVLMAAHYEHVMTVTDPRQAATAFVQFKPDLVLLDVNMPHLDGLAVLKQIRALNTEGIFLPIIVVTGDGSAELKNTALQAGATDFVAKPFNHAEILLRIKNLAELRDVHLELKDQNKKLAKSVRDRTAKLDKAVKKLESTQKQIIQSERLSALGMMARGVALDSTTRSRSSSATANAFTANARKRKTRNSRET